MEKQAALKRIHEKIDFLLNQTESYISKPVSAQEMEMNLLSSLLKLGYELLSYTISSKSKLLSKARKSQKIKFEGMEYKGEKPRKYLCIFGLLEILRDGHWEKGIGNYYELDEALSLPPTQLSYSLQELIGESSSSTNFAESVRQLNKLLGLKLSGKSSERNTDKLGPFVDAYYDSQSIDKKEEVAYFYASFDGKGVPKIVTPVANKDNPKKRLGPGEKRGLKEMATVSVTSCFSPRKRTKSSILKGLMENVKHKSNQILSPLENEEQASDNRWNQEIHRRAFLANQSKAIEYGLDNIRSRMGNINSRFVVPIDGGKGLEPKILAYVKKHQLEQQFEGIIIDIIHVSEYIWNASTVLFEEKSPLRADWVSMALEYLLDSKVYVVLEDLEYTRDKERLSPNKRKQINKTITYLKNNGHNMDYKRFIEKGYPISSALVESTCGHLIKDRMENSGMRWSSNGAQNMMDLRAVKINGDMIDFMRFVSKKQQKSLSNKAA